MKKSHIEILSKSVALNIVQSLAEIMPCAISHWSREDACVRSSQCFTRLKDDSWVSPCYSMERSNSRRSAEMKLLQIDGG